MSPALILALAVAGGPAPGAVEPALAPCAPLAEQAASLAAEGWEESPLGYGEMEGGLVIVVFVSLRGSWTVLSVDDRGIACIEAFGGRWRFLPAPGDPA